MNRLVTLGVKGGPSLRRGGSMPTSSLLELDGQRIVIDAGLGVTRALVEAQMPLTQLSVILITHLHSDHFLELGPLVHTAWTSGLKTPVRIIGPQGIHAVWDGFRQSMAEDIAVREVDEGRVPLDSLVSVQCLPEGAASLGPLTLRALPVPHPPLEHAFALRLDGSRAVTFSGDTAYHPPLAGFAAGSDILVHEALLPGGVEAIVQRLGGDDRLRRHLIAAHCTAEDAGRIAAGAGVGRLVLNHLVPDDRAAFPDKVWQAEAARHFAGPVIVARDGMSLDL